MGLLVRDKVYRGLEVRKYECALCMNRMDRYSKLWQCPNCLQCFDQKCVRGWTRGSSSWQCPGCQCSHQGPQFSFSWTGNSSNPPEQGKSSRPEIEASSQSSGQLCAAEPLISPMGCTEGEELEDGPVSCFCGRHKSKRRFGVDEGGIFSCGKTCGFENGICGHTCRWPCHPRKHSTQYCGHCEHKVIVSCFCGKLQDRQRLCHNLKINERRKLRECKFLLGTSDRPLPVSCGVPCTEELPQQVKSSSVPLSDSICINTADHTLIRLHADRSSLAAGGLLPIRYTSTPRSGSVLSSSVVLPEALPRASPILALMTNTCRCGATSVTELADKMAEEPQTCSTVCGSALSCGRHKCKRICCPFRCLHFPRPSRAKSKNDQPWDYLILQAAQISLEDSESAAHDCTEVCGRLLSCGSHSCELFCHKGKCSPCANFLNTQWKCACGRTRLQPPIRCGTLEPICIFPCHRPRACAHESGHPCHSDEINCDLCYEKLQVDCRCGKIKVDITCFEKTLNLKPTDSLKCYELCNKPLKCGHTCSVLCCNPAEGCPPCNKICGKVYPSCGHEHAESCHFPEPCPETCKRIVRTHCGCGLLSVEHECSEAVEIVCSEECMKELYSSSILEAYFEDPAWLTNVETQIRAFVRAGDRKTLWFKPMNSYRRRAIHELVEHYGLTSKSVDSGSMRSVCAYTTDRMWFPKRCLKDAPRKVPQLTTR